MLVGSALYAWWWYEHGQRYASTDNAYVAGNLIQLTGQTAGTVLAIHANETDRVVVGQTLIELDTTDARIAFDEAQAALARVVRELQTVFAEDGHLRAQIGLREAELSRARTERARAEGDLSRRQAMAQSGAISDEELRHAESAVAAARGAVAMAEAALNSARESRQASRIAVEGTSVETHPNVLRAVTALRAAHVALRRSTIVAPVSAHVARRSVQLGQRIAAGAALMTLVSLEDVWVDANFKESQLRGLRIGQPVRLTADLYGEEIVYDGKVAGLAAGTGSAFALLPAQNATGNWIKVVQRLPVRIALDPKQLAKNPLRVGLSMRVEVDTADQSGKRLADEPSMQAVAQTAVFDSKAADAEVDALAARIIAANLVRRADPASSAAAPARSAGVAPAAATNPSTAVRGRRADGRKLTAPRKSWPQRRHAQRTRTRR